MDHKISVIMGIYNCAPTLRDAVASIQAQTYSNWELILCDDGSTDGTYAVAQALASEDPRIILLQNPKNLGLNQTLNNCLAAATGTYIARMDGDDDCPPDRFERQLSLLENNPEFQITSCPLTMFDETGEWGQTRVPEFPTGADIVRGTPISHAAAMMKKSCVDAVGGYTVDRRMLRVEDVNLWIKLYRAGYRCRNIQQPLYRMRNDRAAFSRRKYIYRLNSAYVRLQGCRMLHLGLKSYLYSLSPILAGLIPISVRQRIRKAQQKAYRHEKDTVSHP